MSWSISETFSRQELQAGMDIGSSLVRKFLSDRTLNNGVESHTAPAAMRSAIDNGVGIEVFGALNVALQTVGTLLQGLGNTWEEVAVTLSGHANPNNEKVDGMAADQISVSVAVSKYIPAPEPVTSDITGVATINAPKLEVVGG